MSAAGITVFIPTYDRPRKLARALDSCLSQTAAPAEVLVVDNGENPETAEVVKAAAEQCANFPVRHLRSKPFDQRAALSRGIAEADGGWMIVLDDDDFLVPDRIRNDTAAIARAGPDCVLIVQDFARINYLNDLVWIHRMAHKELGLAQALTLDALPTTPAATWRSATLKAHHTLDQPGGWLNDFEMFAAVLQHGKAEKSGCIGYVMDDTRTAGRLTAKPIGEYMRVIEMHRERFRPARPLAGLDDAGADRRLDRQKAFFATRNYGFKALFGPEAGNCLRHPVETLKGLASPLRALASRFLADRLPEIRGSESYPLSRLKEQNPDLCGIIQRSKLPNS